MAFEIPAHYSRSFTTNVELLLQQKDSRLGPAVTQAGYVGEQSQVVKQFGAVEFAEKTSRLADTNFSEIEHKQRWVFPTDYDLALPVEKEDEIRMLDSPTSPYASAMRAAWNRKKDSVIYTAALGTSKTGTQGGTSTTFTAGNIVAVDFQIGGGGSDSSMTVGKLLEARRLLSSKEVDEAEQLFCVMSSLEFQSLLNTTSVQSSDFNAVKALVNGEVNRFVGFTFIRYESLTLSSGDNQCLCFAKSGLHLGMWNGLEAHIDQRPDKKYLTQVFMKGTIGATRTQEDKVISVLCNV